MDFFIDIVIKPDAEMRENFLLNRVYTKFHQRLCDLASADIGVSFPEYKLKLGKKLRIHGEQHRLQEMQNINWLGKYSEYCDVSEIQKVPELVNFRVISRFQTNMSPAKLRRLIKRGTIKPDEVKHYKATMFQKGIDNPFLELDSTSNGNTHRRYIQFSDIQNTNVAGEFDTFGLSKSATVPWF
ncbi:MAG: type I-F CRISPR-associated endoribonuclease Cas6/Csy4 [SAR324 cluster bacterium]|nr:type I-F CRISPR-associated endoribonuclease Cas6/Csy4 [SAR324 cluster bacterium]